MMAAMAEIGCPTTQNPRCAGRNVATESFAARKDAA